MIEPRLHVRRNASGSQLPRHVGDKISGGNRLDGTAELLSDELDKTVYLRIVGNSRHGHLHEGGEHQGVQAVGDDGVHRNTDLVDEYNGFDYDYATFGDHACPICFGHGYVGGYSVYNGYRKVIPCEDMNIGGTGILNVETSPYSASSQQLSFEITLPKGVVAIDACRLLNNWDVVPAQGTIDGLPMSPVVIRAKCDGKKHLIAYHFKEPTNFTHFEFQVNLSKKSAYLEFPKLSKNQRMDIIDRLDDFQLLLSPDIPTIDQEDVICDCMLGKAYYVQNTSWLNTRERQMLGWECNVRVVQPQEAFNHLPRRYRTKTRNMTVNPVIGNIGRRV